MKIRNLKINNFRNLQSLSINPAPAINIIHGVNGSGKTSLLETIYLFGYGRSFRSHLAHRLVQHGKDAFSIFGTLHSPDALTHTVGIQRSQAGEHQMRLSGEPLSSVAELARLFPVLLINPNCYQLLDAGPAHRRQFLDWGLFHVEHSFLPAWQQYRRALKQRNALLKAGVLDKTQYDSWNQQLVSAAEEISLMQEAYFKTLVPLFLEILQAFVTVENLSVEYYRGWRRDQSLSVLLETHFAKDLQLGHTYYGPQRSDIRLQVSDIPVQDVLSRGQQKLMFCALQIAQGTLLYERTDKSPIYLIDDLPAELDQHHLKKVISQLTQIESQLFITTLEPESLKPLITDNEVQMFHVEHGIVT